eukprot:1176122-Lingulodinium_polyedra.AAC.1
MRATRGPKRRCFLEAIVARRFLGPERLGIGQSPVNVPNQRNTGYRDAFSTNPNWRGNCARKTGNGD